MNTNKNQDKPLVKTTVSGSRFIPMLFSTPMVQAILNKTKTETRRTQGLEKVNENPDLYRYDGFEKELGYHYFERLNVDKKPLEKYEPIKSKINIDDIIWVRETFQESEFGFLYKATDDYSKNFKWKPSLFMPKKACRIFLKCVSVHAERLQDIDEQSAINEGIEDMLLNVDTPATAYRNYMTTYKDLQKDHWSHVANDAIESYMTLWQKINGVESWNENPFVWVYKFERIERPNDFH
jgi:hypothetical protein